MQYVFGILMFLTSLFLILLVLVQRGRGGGLAGAFGGMGGQSAFGTKAGDLFTRITIVVAAVWILLSIATIKVLNRSHSVFGPRSSGSSAPKDSATNDLAGKGAGLTDQGLPAGVEGGGATTGASLSSPAPVAEGGAVTPSSAKPDGSAATPAEAPASGATSTPAPAAATPVPAADEKK
jgi:preprotein translocase subunit SecG